MNNIVIMSEPDHSKQPLRKIVAGVATFAVIIGLPIFLQMHAGSSDSLSPLQRTQNVRVSGSGASVSTPVTQHGATAWTYDFATKPDGKLSSSDWNIETDPAASNYNGEAEIYTARTDNVRVENGKLVIEAKKETLNGKQYTSARINTKGVFDFTYGTLEVDMMVPKGAGTWPAAWLLPVNNVYKPADYGISATDKFVWALNGEIDFAEAIGSIPGQNIPAIHSYNEVQRTPTYTPGYVPDSATTFHRYGVIKTPTKITFTIDGVEYASRTKTSNNPLDWPYDQPYYLILDLAIGGNWAGTKGIDATSSPWQLQVQSLSYKPL